MEALQAPMMMRGLTNRLGEWFQDISIDPNEDVAELDVPFYVDLSELVLLGQDDEDLHNLGITNHSDTEKEAHN